MHSRTIIYYKHNAYTHGKRHNILNTRMIYIYFFALACVSLARQRLWKACNISCPVSLAPFITNLSPSAVEHNTANLLTNLGPGWREECKLDKVMIHHSIQLRFDPSTVTKGGSLYNLFSNTREHGLNTQFILCSCFLNNPFLQEHNL